MRVVKAAHHPTGVTVVYDDGKVTELTDDQYEAFLDFAVDRFDQKLTRMREILDDMSRE